VFGRPVRIRPFPFSPIPLSLLPDVRLVGISGPILFDQIQKPCDFLADCVDVADLHVEAPSSGSIPPGPTCFFGLTLLNVALLDFIGQAPFHEGQIEVELSSEIIIADERVLGS
jgi:hypothetical protein